MTKQNFIALADTIRQAKPISTLPGMSPFGEGYDAGRASMWGYMCEVMADYCAAQSTQFNRDRWLGYIDGTNGPNGGAMDKGKSK